MTPLEEALLERVRELEACLDRVENIVHLPASYPKVVKDVKRKTVREYYARNYPQQNQQQIAHRFGISDRTLRRYIKEA